MNPAGWSWVALWRDCARSLQHDAFERRHRRNSFAGVAEIHPTRSKQPPASRYSPTRARFALCLTCVNAVADAGMAATTATGSPIAAAKRFADAPSPDTYGACDLRMITLPSTLTTVDQQHGYTSRGPTNRGQGRWSSRVVEIEHDVRILGHRTLVVLLALRCDFDDRDQRKRSIL
jgi:hypothetical protein